MSSLLVLIELVDYTVRQVWYLSGTALLTIAPLTVSLVSSPPSLPPPSLCE
jgi:hypothetical protein